ncbi:hypothetical protein F0562_008091 [Nyssa sinensis]|uniref:26S proteasome regulatory subunit Rpn7 N-terminal domain-containing protein n=1 Tax=Nyssa sinensis TaxID=561372 RepID=A0A5J5A6U9_9ASTE|nr:hypothetical protein F0562_008091 [Nyssa sinensis]
MPPKANDWLFNHSIETVVSGKAVHNLPVGSSELADNHADNNDDGLLRHPLRSYLDNVGNVPEEISKLTSLTYLNIAQNDFEGELPSSFGKLFIMVAKNRFSGSLPQLNMPSLTFLGVNINMLFRELPTEICNASSLANLSLSDNNSIEPEIHDPKDEFVVNVCSHFAMIFHVENSSTNTSRSTAPLGGPTLSSSISANCKSRNSTCSDLKILDPLIFLDALADVLVAENRLNAKAALSALNVLAETLLFLARSKHTDVLMSRGGPGPPIIVSSPSYLAGTNWRSFGFWCFGWKALEWDTMILEIFTTAHGSLPDASKSYVHSRDYCTTSKHIIHMCLNAILVSIKMGQFTHATSNVGKAEQNPDALDDVLLDWPSWKVKSTSETGLSGLLLLDPWVLKVLVYPFQYSFDLLFQHSKGSGLFQQHWLFNEFVQLDKAYHHLMSGCLLVKISHHSFFNQCSSCLRDPASWSCYTLITGCSNALHANKHASYL